MKIFKYLSLLSLSIFLVSCSTANKNQDTKAPKVAKAKMVKSEDLKSASKAYFASGCFWCVEAIFESVEGVSEAISGYSGGVLENPTYELIGTGTLKHAEAVEVYYDPAVVSFETLVTVFFGSHDPTTFNQQGPDKGPQYRSIAFYENAEEKKIILDAIKSLEAAKIYPNKIVTEVLPFEKFWDAEDYHQDYEANHPENPYVQHVSIPRLNRFKAKFPELLKKEH